MNIDESRYGNDQETNIISGNCQELTHWVNSEEAEQNLSSGLKTGVIRTTNHLQMKSDRNIQFFANKFTYVVNSNDADSIYTIHEYIQNYRIG